MLIRPYDLLLGEATGWRMLEASGASIQTGRIGLETLQSLHPDLAEDNGTFGGHALPRGVAIWGDEIFIADPPRHRILHWRPCCGPPVPLPTIGGQGHAARQLSTPLGLAISHRKDLVVVDSGNRRLLLFTLPGLALRRILGPFNSRGKCGDLEEPEPEEWRPVDVASGPDGTLYVADENGSIWRLDSQGRPDPCYPGRLPEGSVPFRLLVGGDHHAYVLAQGNANVLVVDPYGHFLSEISSLDQELVSHTGGTLRTRLPASRLGLDGEVVTLAPSDPLACHMEPQHTDLTVDESGHLTLAGYSDGPYILHRPPVAIFQTSGIFRTLPLDSRRVGNQWHRVVQELDAPERTSVRMFSFTSDVLRPDLKAVDPPSADLLAEPPRLGPWQAAPNNADEWLIQSMPGRYLYLALVLKGPGNRTPAVERIYIYNHRESSLQYLPAVYQADETSHSLLDRLLSLFDTILGEIESEIEDFPRRLDIRGATSDFLPWLASWFDLTLEQSWSDTKRRDFLKKIVKLYRWRGTIYGLRQLLQLHAGLIEPLPQIIEHYRGKVATLDESDDQVVSDSMRNWLGQPPVRDVMNHFSVLMPGYTIDTPEKRAVVERLIDASKPAHTHYTLRPLYSGTRIGSAKCKGSAISVDSVLGSHGVWHLPNDTEKEGILGARTVLPAAPLPYAVAVRLGHTRLGAPRLGSRICSPCEET